jgi:hypothetical protein
MSRYATRCCGVFGKAVEHSPGGSMEDLRTACSALKIRNYELCYVIISFAELEIKALLKS